MIQDRSPTPLVSFGVSAFAGVAAAAPVATEQQGLCHLKGITKDKVFELI